jgi:hypothetical protein
MQRKKYQKEIVSTATKSSNDTNVNILLPRHLKINKDSEAQKIITTTMPLIKHM